MPFFAQHTRTALLASAAFTAVAAVAAPAWAAPTDVAIYYDLKPQSLEAALHIVAERSGRAILAPTALLAGKQAPALHGRFTALDAYKALLAGSGLQITLVGDTVIVHAPDAAAAAAPVNEGAVAEIVVTGSHIRGEASAAPTDIITSKQIEETGYSQVGDVIRSLPENYSGGQKSRCADRRWRDQHRQSKHDQRLERQSPRPWKRRHPCLDRWSSACGRWRISGA